MTTVTIYGGANMIGGNKILLEDDDSRLFFDFGARRSATPHRERREQEQHTSGHFLTPLPSSEN